MVFNAFVRLAKGENVLAEHFLFQKCIGIRHRVVVDISQRRVKFKAQRKHDM